MLADYINGKDTARYSYDKNGKVIVNDSGEWVDLDVLNEGNKLVGKAFGTLYESLLNGTGLLTETAKYIDNALAILDFIANPVLTGLTAEMMMIRSVLITLKQKINSILDIALFGNLTGASLSATTFSVDFDPIPRTSQLFKKLKEVVYKWPNHPDKEDSVWGVLFIPHYLLGVEIENWYNTLQKDISSIKRAVMDYSDSVTDLYEDYVKYIGNVDKRASLRADLERERANRKRTLTEAIEKIDTSVSSNIKTIKESDIEGVLTKYYLDKSTELSRVFSDNKILKQDAFIDRNNNLIIDFSDGPNRFMIHSIHMTINRPDKNIVFSTEIYSNIHVRLHRMYNIISELVKDANSKEEVSSGGFFLNNIPTLESEIYKKLYFDLLKDYPNMRHQHTLGTLYTLKYIINNDLLDQDNSVYTSVDFSYRERFEDIYIRNKSKPLTPSTITIDLAGIIPESILNTLTGKDSTSSLNAGDILVTIYFSENDMYAYPDYFLDKTVGFGYLDDAYKAQTSGIVGYIETSKSSSLISLVGDEPAKMKVPNVHMTAPRAVLEELLDLPFIGLSLKNLNRVAIPLSNYNFIKDVKGKASMNGSWAKIESPRYALAALLGDDVMDNIDYLRKNLNDIMDCFIKTTELTLGISKATKNLIYKLKLYIDKILRSDLLDILNNLINLGNSPAPGIYVATFRGNYKKIASVIGSAINQKGIAGSTYGGTLIVGEVEGILTFLKIFNEIMDAVNDINRYVDTEKTNLKDIYNSSKREVVEQNYQLIKNIKDINPQFPLPTVIKGPILTDIDLTVDLEVDDATLEEVLTTLQNSNFIANFKDINVALRTKYADILK